MTLLSDFIEPDLNISDVVHSSGYAQAASGGRVGSGGSRLSMEQRRKLLYGRQVVGSYQQSTLGRQYGDAKPKTVDELQQAREQRDNMYEKRVGKRTKPGAPGVKGRPSSAADGTISSNNIERRQQFIEPPSRSYNPYG